MEQTARTRFRFALAAGLALFAVSSPATAQSFAPTPFAKTDAILGAQSSLAAVMAAQSSGAAVQAVASGALQLTYPIVRPAPFSTPKSAFDLGASPTRPDIFNSIAMPIDRAPFDDRWDRVASASFGGRAARFAAALQHRDERARLEAINAYVNARVAFTDDIRQFGVADRWSAASFTLSRGRGDCEDYALAKLAMLRRAGFADRDLYFVVLKDLARRADHAVLVVRSGGRFLVLDNSTDALVDSAAIRDYRPILTFTAGQRFTHGYRRSLNPRVIMASDSVARAPQARSSRPPPAYPRRRSPRAEPPLT